jgi:hypothetical protein
MGGEERGSWGEIGEGRLGRLGPREGAGAAGPARRRPMAREREKGGERERKRKGKKKRFLLIFEIRSS